jgi:hypothetical protein
MKAPALYFLGNGAQANAEFVGEVSRDVTRRILNVRKNTHAHVWNRERFRVNLTHIQTNSMADASYGYPS